MTTLRNVIVGVLSSARQGFEEEGGSPRAINGAILAVAAALVGQTLVQGGYSLDSVKKDPWRD